LLVTVSGLRWVCRMLLVPIPWASRVWALPCLRARAPSARDAAPRGRPHTASTSWARQLIRLVHRWLPERHLVRGGDRGDAARDLLDAVRPVATITGTKLSPAEQLQYAGMAAFSRGVPCSNRASAASSGAL
jgi:hypothetical protein